MQQREFLDEFEILAKVFTKDLPSDIKERGEAALVWYDHFSHIPKEMFARAAKHCRENERFLSIAALWQSIIEVADVPSAYEIREELNNRETITRFHPIAKRIYVVLDLQWADSELTDIAFEREYKRAREWYVNLIMQPENVGLLTGTPKLEERKC